MIAYTWLHSINPLAIVGMSCRFPGIARDIEGFWRLLVTGEHVLSPVPKLRFDAQKYFDAPMLDVMQKIPNINADFSLEQLDKTINFISSWLSK